MRSVPVSAAVTASWLLHIDAMRATQTHIRLRHTSSLSVSAHQDSQWSLESAAQAHIRLKGTVSKVRASHALTLTHRLMLLLS